MTSYSQFIRKCKMRNDFGDQIQVRYRHSDDEDYDTWVSGEEVLQRLRSDAAESKLQDLGRTDWQQVRDLAKKLPKDVRNKLQSEFQDRLADSLDEAIGGNEIGDSLADAVRGQDPDEDPGADQPSQWSVLIQDQAFRAKVLELAWIQLEGSFPDTGPADEPDDWV
jgi:hypothetical protein